MLDRVDADAALRSVDDISASFRLGSAAIDGTLALGGTPPDGAGLPARLTLASSRLPAGLTATGSVSVEGPVLTVSSEQVAAARAVLRMAPADGSPVVRKVAAG